MKIVNNPSGDKRRFFRFYQSVKIFINVNEQHTFYWFSSVTEGKHMADQSMLVVSCICSHQFVIIGGKAFLSVLLENSNHQYPPMPSPLHLEILKAICGTGMDIFWNCPITSLE